MANLTDWQAKYLDLGIDRPSRRRCVSYRALANHMASLLLEASRTDILARLATFVADDAEFWAGVLAKMQELPPDADWFGAMDVLCHWLSRENYLFVPAIMLDWLLDGK